MNKSFSLLELLVVMGVIVLVALGGSIYLTRFNRQQDLDNTSATIISLLRDAQQRSILQEAGNYWGVQFDNISTGRDRFLLFRSSDKEGLNSTIIRTLYLKSSLNFVRPVSDESIKVVFNKIFGNLVSSTCPSTGGMIIVEVVGGNQKTINVHCFGKIE